MTTRKTTTRLDERRLKSDSRLGTEERGSEEVYASNSTPRGNREALLIAFHNFRPMLRGRIAKLQTTAEGYDKTPRGNAGNSVIATEEPATRCTPRQNALLERQQLNTAFQL